MPFQSVKFFVRYAVSKTWSLWKSHSQLNRALLWPPTYFSNQGIQFQQDKIFIRKLLCGRRHFCFHRKQKSWERGNSLTAWPSLRDHAWHGGSEQKVIGKSSDSAGNETSFIYKKLFFETFPNFISYLQALCSPSSCWELHYLRFCWIATYIVASMEETSRKRQFKDNGCPRIWINGTQHNIKKVNVNNIDAVNV